MFLMPAQPVAHDAARPVCGEQPRRRPGRVLPVCLVITGFLVAVPGEPPPDLGAFAAGALGESVRYDVVDSGPRGEAHVEGVAQVLSFGGGQAVLVAVAGGG